MERVTIQANKRQDLGTRQARRLRLEGLVPAVLYGHRRDPVHLSVLQKDVERLIHAGTRMLDLEIGGTVETALLKDIQYDSMGDHLIHVDLARVAMDEKVDVTVRVELHGLAKGVSSGGIMDHLVQDIELRCFPADIPEKIRIEVADLDIDQIIHIRDLPPVAGVEYLQDPDTPVVAIHPPVAVKAEEAEEVPAEAAEPEVIGERREQEPEGDEDKEESGGR